MEKDWGYELRVTWSELRVKEQKKWINSKG